MPIIQQWELRAEFARRLSDLYGHEVPAYASMLEVANAVNKKVLTNQGVVGERLGSAARVTAERHGAIRVGTPDELAQVARIFGGMGMHPVGFYDLREASSSSVPVVSTAFRPIEAEELARNPFRVFTSMLVPSDRRFFSADLQQRLDNFLGRRRLFEPELLVLADRAETYGGLDEKDSETFLRLATSAFELSPAAVDRAWYRELEQVSSVAADIGGVTSTHINHLTPRVLDIDSLYEQMQRRGIEMIETIQGPPRWNGPDLLLRQTSFRALAEPRVFRESDGTVVKGSLRVRFGEVEARGIAATPRGRGVYDRLTGDIEQAVREAAVHGPVTASDRTTIAAALWNKNVPATEYVLALDDLAYFTFTPTDRRADGSVPSASLSGMIAQGWLRPDPIVYEDFLPKSAAGIFQSNLTSEGRRDLTQTSTDQINADWMAGVLGRTVHDPYELYSEIRRASLTAAAEHLGLAWPIEPTPSTTPQESNR
ncbi:VOC family protein [Rhodococcus sp. IEGM 1381]|uniref:2-oxoadipate dioxygenase/decarboxylase n=1 Tax=Rhodococcus sp. IEGM 1381 TaxID=3047085 RepID=UPI0024B755A6|nr:VOC family protein [Rhodococcus sp. IEGM 1381]MDI9893669.1 VOC family protein [Rhodococcus sp. IEGM 1381]